MAHSHLYDCHSLLSCHRPQSRGLVAMPGLSPRRLYGVGRRTGRGQRGLGCLSRMPTSPFQAPGPRPGPRTSATSACVCLHSRVTAAGRKQLGGARRWHCVTAGPPWPPSCFQRVEATGACHRKQRNGFHTLQETRDVTGRLLLVLKGQFLAKCKRLLAGPHTREASERRRVSAS